MANWNAPTVTTVYTDVFTISGEKFEDCAKMFDGSTSSNIPTGAYRINGAGSNELQKYNGSSWDLQNLRVGDFAANNVIAGYEGAGRVSMTINDGYGNANLAFNHDHGIPDRAGSSARIQCSVDSVAASMSIELKNNTAAGTAADLTQVALLEEDAITLRVDTAIDGDLAVTGTVDGRDVLADGTRLDTIPTYAIGDTGPAGGLVFYITAGGTKGLEAAPSDQSTGIRWDNSSSPSQDTSAESTGINAGLMNTMLIVSKQSTDHTTYAAGLCSRLFVTTAGVTYGGYYLPSSYELGLMYTNLHANSVGGFSDDDYWSSTQVSGFAMLASSQDFLQGNISSSTAKTGTYKVRACRAF